MFNGRNDGLNGPECQIKYKKVLIIILRTYLYAAIVVESLSVVEVPGMM